MFHTSGLSCIVFCWWCQKVGCCHTVKFHLSWSSKELFEDFPEQVQTADVGTGVEILCSSYYKQHEDIYCRCDGIYFVQNVPIVNCETNSDPAVCPQATPPSYCFFDTKTNFASVGRMRPPGRSFIGCLTAMGADCDEFVAGETTHDMRVRTSVCVGLSLSLCGSQ